jgi:hypothetical protein
MAEIDADIAWACRTGRIGKALAGCTWRHGPAADIIRRPSWRDRGIRVGIPVWFRALDTPLKETLGDTK